ncbi:MAG: peptidylprolyl isomerase [Alteraurantiacibacter sp.]
MTTPNSGDTVTIDYVVKTGDGQQVGTTADAGPQDIVLGQGQIFPQVEQAITGMEVGKETTVEIPCANAFGERQEQLVVDIPRANLPPESAPQPGMQLQSQTPEGQPFILHIVEIGDETVKCDANHPLAGQDVTFDITLRHIKQAA